MPEVVVVVISRGPQGLPGSGGSAVPPNQLPTATGDVALGGHKLTGVGDATAATDALNRESGDARYDALGAAATEATRATTAEALKAPLASPALTGAPTAPTQTALDGTTKLATTAYADGGVAVEKSRAQGVEATNAAAISSEATRAAAAEVLKAPLASPALTGAPTAPTATALDNTTKLATTAYADAAVAVEAARAAAAEAAKAQGLTPTAVKTGTYAAAAGEYVPFDLSGGVGALNLPAAPADKTRIGFKIVLQAATPNALAVNRGGSTDVFNKAGGSTALTFAAVNTSGILQYAAATGLWYLQSTDSPLDQPSGAAKLGTDGTVGGAGGSALVAAVVLDASASPKDIDTTGVADTNVLAYSAGSGKFVPAAAGGGGAVSSVFTRSGAITAQSGDYSVAQVTGAAPLASPTFTGTPAAPTASALTNTTQLATTAYADAADTAVKAATNAWTGVNTFSGGPGARFDDADTGAAARTFSLSPRVGTAGANTFTFPIPTLRPTTATKICAMDIMPNGSPSQDAQNGMCWLDVCNADVLNVSAGAVGTARVAAFTDHVEYGSHAYNGATKLDVWLAAENSGSSTPQICINATTGLVSIFSKTQNTNTMLTSVAAATNYIPLAAVGLTSHATDLFACYIGGVNGTRVWSVGSTGIPKWGNSNGQTTVGAAGAASALPATPSRYLKVTGDDGTSYVIPAYLPV